MNTKEFIYLEHSRANVFNMFSALFCQPEEDLLKEKETMNTFSYALNILNAGCDTYIANMEEALKKYSMQELLIEYTRLFIGPFKVLVHPYSSLYFGHDALMNDKTIWVENFYRKAGLAFDYEAIKDLPDHITVETEFIYYLIFSEIQALDENENSQNAFKLWETQMKFINKHYKKWVPKFCEKIMNETNNEYYKNLSECLNKFVTSVDIPSYPTK